MEDRGVPAEGSDPRTGHRRRAGTEALADAVADAILQLAADNAPLAARAAALWRTMAGSSPPGQITQDRLQTFLWEFLPAWRQGDPYMLSADAAAFAALCSALGRDRLAEACVSEETSEIFKASAQRGPLASALSSAAADRSGVQPPDTPFFTWQVLPSPAEEVAREQVAAELEEAIEEGRLQPGEAGWRGQQRALTDRVLDRAQPSHPTGETWRQAVTTARLQTWIDEPSAASPQRRALIGAIEARLLHPVDPPPSADALTEPLRWLLAQAGGAGIALTDRGNLNRATVVQAHSRFANRFGTQRWGPTPPRREADLRPLAQWHRLARAQRWVRRERGRLRTTQRGTLVRDDVGRAWAGLAAALGEGAGFEGLCHESVLLLLVTEASNDRATLIAAVRDLAVAAGWQTAGGTAEQLPDPVESCTERLLRRLDDLAIVATTSATSPPGDSLTLAPGGRATLLEALRVRSTGPARGDRAQLAG